MARIKELLQLGREQLDNVTDVAALEAELLLAHALQQPRSYLYAWPERQVAAEELQTYAGLIHERRQGRPLAYLTGQREFWSMNLRVSPATLIPRPDTETLVEQALERIPAQAAWELLDLGTGSGAIALALAQERPYCHITATDSSAAALQVARDNAAQLAPNVRFVEGEWFAPLGDQRFHLIVSNPPYIATHDPHLAQGDVRFEPHSALVAGALGLDAFEAIIAGAPDHLYPHGWLLLEHGFEQADAVQEILEQNEFKTVFSALDAAGQPRVSGGQYINQY